MAKLRAPSGSATPKRKKFYFTGEADMDLLKVGLKRRLFTVAQGQRGTAYQKMATELGQRFHATLSSRTVKERLKFLVDEFRTTDQMNCKKSRTAAEYKEFKQLLVAVTKQMNNSHTGEDTTDQLQSQEQPGKRMCQRKSLEDSDSDASVEADQHEWSGSIEDQTLLPTAEEGEEVPGLVTEAIDKDERRWEADMALRKEREENKKRRWAQELAMRRDEASIRRAELEIRREEMALLHQLVLKQQQRQ